MVRKKRPQKQLSNLKQGKQANTLRIIGGQWRSRKLQLTDAPGMRPTPDRVRETLFNWLQNDIHGTYCLDLFAGSGALGVEALSRGAKAVTFVEKNKAVAHQLSTNLALLKSAAEIIQADALEYLSQLSKQSSDTENRVFDIVFLDPPYRKGLLKSSLSLLNKYNLMDKNTLVYLEHEAEESFDWGDFGLHILKETSMGQVKCLLAINNHIASI